MHTVVIQGSSRSNGDTRTAINFLSGHLPFDLVDLLDYRIEPYDYEHRHHGVDDFMPLMRQLVAYDKWVFATPVYWYTMSGLMKNFVDRFTDCLKVEKQTGRLLRGKTLAALSVSSEPEPVESFFVPFRLTADYLGMHYGGDVHLGMVSHELDEEGRRRIRGFAERLGKI